ncbi:MAG: phosphocholine cytidylyltransferase family protein [Chlorobi bacterium]|nr:phosphocholine cytidylyltransferase family protein [Chlorobiota bacterium]
MKAIILAAGTASRLRPLTDNTPKCLLNVGNKSILQRTIENLLSNEIDEFVIVTGYLGGMIEKFVAENFPDLKVVFIHNEKYSSTNNIYSLWMTKKHALNNEIFLLDSDIVFDSRIVGLLKNSGYENCLAVKTGIELSDEEIKITVNKDNSISEISKTVELSRALGESIGIEKFGKRFVENLFAELDKMILDENLSNVFYEAAFERLIRKGKEIYSVSVENLKCLEIDFPEDFERAAVEVLEMK